MPSISTGSSGVVPAGRATPERSDSSLPATRYVPPALSEVPTYGAFPTAQRAGQLYTTEVPTGSYALPFIGQAPDGDLYNRLESRTTLAQQAPTRVFQGADRLIGQSITPFQQVATNLLYGSGTPQPQNVSLMQGFRGGNDLNSALRGGIDYFGRLGLSEGVQNIMAQENRANQAIREQLGRNAGNSGLLSVLQNQNRMRSQMAINPLLSEAQRGTLDRSSQQLSLDNAMMQLVNQARQAETGFNNQNQFSQFQTQLQAMQPYQNFLELLSALQGQARGLQSNEGSFAGKNFQ